MNKKKAGGCGILALGLALAVAGAGWKVGGDAPAGEETQQIVAPPGGIEYMTVDRKNQTDMKHPELAEQFCQAVEAGETAQTRILVVEENPEGLLVYHMRTKDGIVTIGRTYYQCQDGSLVNMGTASYQAEYIEYTKEGYLFFGGSYQMETRWAMELCAGREAVALRVQPLDPVCREWNRRCCLPVGYGRNNLFLVDWSGEDLGELDLYDVFERFYPLVYQRPCPYPADKDLGTGAVYQVPEEEFEKVVFSYFQIDRETLRERTAYDPGEGTYTYRPRGFYETEETDIPYPEVVRCTERADGTLALTVNAVYAAERTARAYSHEVVVRPLEDGQFQYVSNRMLSSGEELDLWWHTDRLTSEEWEELYGK